MNRPNLVRSVYAELREVAGDMASRAELLRLASAMIDAAQTKGSCSGSELSGHTGGVPFDRWALDRAMADGGWRILRYETELGTCVYGDDYESDPIDIGFRDWMMENAA